MQVGLSRTLEGAREFGWSASDSWSRCRTTKEVGDALTISPEQRDALYGEAACEMTGVGDIYHALDHDDPAEARRLRRRYEDVMRLLDDIGWTEEDPRERIPLTMHADQLVRVAHLLGSRALEQMKAHETVIDEERPLRERHALVASTCSDLLEQLTLNSPSSIVNA